MLAWLLGACVASPDQRADLNPTSGTLPAIDFARVVDHTEAVLAVGPRLVATPGEAAAAAVVAERFARAGFAVDTHAFVFDAWRPGIATLTIAGETRDIHAFSPTPTASVTGPLLAPASDDAVAVYESADASRAEQFLDASFAGASAFVRITDDLGPAGEDLVEVGHTLVGSTLPGVGVGSDDGAWVRAHLGEAATLDVVPDLALGHVGKNLGVTRAGSGPGLVVVVAHYDSWDLSESAFDNGLGVGALLAFADRLGAGPDPEQTVILLATTGEEQGLQGAMAYVADHPELFDQVVTVFTLDVVWSGAGEYRVMATDPAWVTAGVFAAEAEGLVAVAGEGPGVASDHFPFALQGATAIWAGRFGDPHYHTSADTLDALNLDEATAAVRAAWRLLADAAGLDPEPG